MSEIDDAQLKAYITRLRFKWRLLRFRAGLETVRQASYVSGVSYSMIAKIERWGSQQMPTVETLLKLARAYDVDPPEMMTDKLPPEPFKHLATAVQEFLADPKNLKWVKRAWILAVHEAMHKKGEPPAAVLLEDLSPDILEGPMGISLAAWAADPQNGKWLAAGQVLRKTESNEGIEQAQDFYLWLIRRAKGELEEESGED